MFRTRPILLCLPFLALFCGLWGAGGIAAQALQVVRPASRDGLAVELDSEVRRDFEKAFRAIASRAHITIVAEGVPLHPVLSDSQFADFNEAFSKSGHPSLQQQITLEATAFDYDVEQVSAKVFLLRKRYSDPMDLPNVTYAEIIGSLKAITDLAGGAPIDGEDPPQIRLYRALTPEQKQQALTGTPVSRLSADQAALANEVPVQMLLGGRTLLTRQTLDNLTRIEDPQVVFGWMDLRLEGKTGTGQTASELAAAGNQPFGYYGAIGKNGYFGQRPLSEGYESFGAGFKILDTNRTGEAPAGSAIPTPADERLASGMMANALSSTKTLQDAVLMQAAAKADEKASATTPATPGFRITVDPAVEPKPVCLFGVDYCDRDDFLRSLAAVYDLRLSQPEHGHYHIGLQKRKTLDSIGDFAAEVLRLIPSPLFRSYIRQKSAFLAKESAGMLPPPNDPVHVKEMVMKGKNNFLAAQAAMRVYYYPAVRRLLSFAVKAAAASPTKTVPVNSLNPEASRLIALADFSSGQVNSELYRILDFKTPDFLQHPDTLCIKFQVVPGNTPTLFTSLGSMDESGVFKVQVAGGVSMPAAAP